MASAWGNSWGQAWGQAWGGSFEANAEPGSYVLTSFPAFGVAAKIGIAESGAYTIAGFDAFGAEAEIVNAEAGVYAITGFDAFGEISGIAPTIDTHDGDAWRRYRKKLERIVNMQDALEAVQEAPKEAIEAIQDADVKPKVKAKIASLDYQKVINDRKLQEFIARQLLIVVELQRIAQEDDDLLTFMMMD